MNGESTSSTDLINLAKAAGIQPEYYDLSGALRQAAPEALVAAMNVLGLPVKTADNLSDGWNYLREEGKRNPFPKVIVAWEGELPPVRVKESALVNGKFESWLELEDGERLKSFAEKEPVELESMSLSFEQNSTVRLPIGYHRLLVENNQQRHEILVISAPRKSYSGQEGPRRDWGLFAPLYGFKSDRNWGAGDFADGARFAKWCGRQGAGVWGMLPTLATYLREPCHPSPYWPVSRLFWNEFFVDPEKLPEFQRCPEAQRLLTSSAFTDAVRLLKSESLVDYAAVMSLKRQILELLAVTLQEKGSRYRLGRFRRFLERRPETHDYARFRTLQEEYSPVWQNWPQSPPAGDNLPAGCSNATVHYHEYVQWAAEEQMQGMTDSAANAGVKLYLDMPVGVHPHGYDTWRERESFAFGASAGAPPDPLGPEGQNWGFPPLHPEGIRRQHYSYFRKMLAHQMSKAGILRIDHVMGFHRLFWIPEGFSGRDGVYVRYHADESHAIINIESHRNQCEVVGEDLGTVPDEVREAMQQHGLKRMFVLPFEARMDSPELLPAPHDDSIASLNTHDMHPFAAFWSGLDIKDRVEVGLLDPNCEQPVLEQRRILTGALSFFLEKRRLLDSKREEESRTAFEACIRYLAESDAHILLINLEDLWGEIEPQNRPGTGDELHNWRRKFALNLEQVINNSDIKAFLRSVQEWRSKGDQTMTPAKSDTKKTKSEAKATKSPRVAAKTIKPKKVAQAIQISGSQPLFLMTEDDRYLFNEGTHFRLYDKLGARTRELDGIKGCHFAVWAPDAVSVHVMGDFNGWSRESHPLYPNAQSGVWEGFIPGLGERTIYKYFVRSRVNGHQAEKADPFAFHAETPPKTGSIVWGLDYKWGDQDWMGSRVDKSRLSSPISTYEMHIGSWRRVVEDGDRPLSYRELADQLPGYLKDLGFTHVEFLPIMEHPFYGSWGYQTTGYFAPTSRFGTPQDFMYLIDVLHQAGIGVILDWVPSHFPTDGHGLGLFDGTSLYEHQDNRKGFHPDWQSAIFNYGRKEVSCFLASSALFWLDKFHADGIRVDAVASMLYLDYSRMPGEWLPNKFGGRENLEAIDFLRRLNEEIYLEFPDVQTIAEESTAWPMVSRPTYLGGLGFGLKWDMGWMHDTLEYFSKEPIHRRFHHNSLTFRMLYAWHENFVLPLSHDEVVHGKGSLLSRMPGDLWQKFANLRLLLTVQFTQPGKKLLFMGSEIGQWGEWNHDKSLDWHLLSYASHEGLQRLVGDLNRVYKQEPALHELDCDQAGFEWVDCNDADTSVVSFLRKSKGTSEIVLVALNFTPVPRFDYRVGVPHGGAWKELLNSDSEHYSGSGKGNLGEVYATGEGFRGQPDSLLITLPPLGGVILKP